MATPAELFDQITEMLYGYCDAPEVVIRVEMEFDSNPFGLAVIRHIRDSDHLFDNSRDRELALPEDQMAAIRARVRDYFEISKGWKDRLLRTTLSVYQDGQWSVGSTSQTV
jgi:hypothetical protein